jgi:hypothetical protein
MQLDSNLAPTPGSPVIGFAPVRSNAPDLTGVVFAYRNDAGAYQSTIMPPLLTIGSAASDSIVVNWTAAVAIAGLGATPYQFQYSTDNQTWYNFSPATASLTATLTGLTPGTLYYFRVNTTDLDANLATSLIVEATTP